MTQIVASLVERSITGVSDSSRLAFKEGADLVECRMDHLSGLSKKTVAEARMAILGPTIATLRSKREGGRSGLSGIRREQMLRTVLESDFEYVDLELHSDKRLLKEIGQEDWDFETIVSTHFTKPVSKQTVLRHLDEAHAIGDIAKVAMPCEHADHALMLASIGLSLSRRRMRYVLVGMGDQGQLTRVFADTIGSNLVYSCLPGREAAPGQLEVASQSKLLHDKRTIFGLIGHPVSHSVSRPMQEAAMKDLGMLGAYLPLDFKPGTLNRRALNTVRALGFKGVNVTIPHKRTAFDLCDKTGEYAKETRAVNTIRFTGSSFAGENTDVNGFSRLIDGKTNITRDTKTLVIGAGGAARSIVYVLSQRGAKTTIIDIDKKRARRLAATFGARTAPLNRTLNRGGHFDLVVNCSPVGMKGVPGNPVKPTVFGPGSVFIDIIFNPPVTQAMRTAEASGARAFGGLEMLVQQGAESFRLWTGLEPNVDVMREAARRALE
jgi:shikimate dehydrogenase/3-dehydroquinate dehydratase type I